MFILHLRGSHSGAFNFDELSSSAEELTVSEFSVDFLLRKFAACRSHQAVIIIVKRVIYPTTQKRHQGVG